MASKHLNKFPKPLLDDLVAGRWLPIVGAGFSRNAVLPVKKKMPLWSELGDLLKADLRDYEPVSALDAISAYEHEYGRPKLIERLSDLLHIDEARPGEAHKAFCSIQFDLVCTTNFDFLLERQYDLIPRHCTPLVDEEQLAVNLKESGTALLKLHGDLNHPGRLVAAETDYDRFLNSFPLLATYLANLLITRTAVLVGYSLDDPDFRQVWQVVAERLGRSRRIAYVVLVGASATEIARYERRGIKVVNLHGAKTRYGQTLAEAFTELSEYWRNAVIPASQVKEEQPLRELSLPTGSPTRLCFFAVPLSLLSFYRERVFPVVTEFGFVPVTADDVVAPGDAFIAKIDALISRARLMVVDTSSDYTLQELRLALKQMASSRILIVTPAGVSLPIDIAEATVLPRPDIASADPEDFLNRLGTWLSTAEQEYAPTLTDEPNRLLQAGEYRAAVIAAITLLESTLRERYKQTSASYSRPTPLKTLLEMAQEDGRLGNIPIETAQGWLAIRNQAVHTDRQVARAEATQIVRGVSQIISRR
jgi:SIR2-like protein